MHPITKELREYVRAVRAYHLTDIHGKKREYVDTTTRELLDIADRIDAEHERRMDGRVEVVRCRDCESATKSHYSDCLVCCMHGIHVDGNFYCANGARREVDE